jgi:rare lipoprotein A
VRTHQDEGQGVHARLKAISSEGAAALRKLTASARVGVENPAVEAGLALFQREAISQTVWLLSRAGARVAASLQASKETVKTECIRRGPQVMISGCVRRNKRVVVVTVNGRGNFKRGRFVDVSPTAAKSLGVKSKGVAPVKISPVAEQQRRHDAASLTLRVSLR